MMKRYWLNRVKISSLGLIAGVTLIVAGLPSPASAQIVQVSQRRRAKLGGVQLRLLRGSW